MPAALAPRYWGVHLVMVVAVAACVLLGRWQLGVWHDHRTDDAARVTRQAAVALTDVLGPDAAFPAAGLGRPVVVEGRWDPAQTWYISGRERDGRNGYWAVTEVVVSPGVEIPVVRGWVADLVGHVPPPPTGRAALVGLLQPSEDTGAAGQPDDADAEDVLPELNIAVLLQRTHLDLFSGYVIATDRAVPGSSPRTGTAGLAPVTVDHLPGAGTSSGLRNLLYALQWWVFGAFALFMWWRWLQEDVLGARPSPDAG